MAECCISLGLPEAFRPLVHLYALRILVKLGGHRHLLDDRRVSDPDVFHDLGIGLPSPELPYRPDLLLIKLRRKLLDLDRRAPTAPSDATLTRNLHWLSRTLDLSQVEANIVQFLAVVHHAPLVRTLLEKSAFAHHLAEVLDRPLIVKRASDLQSKWVGETEQNLARMFEEAAQENAALLLDEADSFLAGRRGAQRSWEVSQVNELLTQMEAFEGVFIASTNLLETLDQAAPRRFDLKIRFGYLAPRQCEALFRDCMATLRLPVDVASLAMVSSMPRLTPGDFGNVMRQARLDPIPSGMAFSERLAQECQLKAGASRRSIGF